MDQENGTEEVQENLNKMMLDIEDKIDALAKREFVVRESKMLCDLDGIVNVMDSVKRDIEQNLDIVEMIDLLIDTYTYKQYECTHNYTSRMEAMKTHQNNLLTSSMSRSELVLQLAEIDQALQDTREHYEKKSVNLNEEKIVIQDKYETVVQLLDAAFESFSKHYDKLLATYEDQKLHATLSETEILRETYPERFTKFEEDMDRYRKLQLAGWRIIHSEEKIAGLLEGKGLKITRSGRVITKKGELYTLKEAFNRGLLEGIDVEWTKFFSKSLLPTYVGGVSSESFSVSDKMSSEDISYLKQTVGKPLTLALAEVSVKQPKDPIHYLAHWLFKYRYNKEVSEQHEEEVKKLIAERERIAKERWQAFLEDEARAAVWDMITKAEDMAIQNELRRIEMEALMAEEEAEEEYEEGLDDEARDQLGVYDGPPVNRRPM